MSNEFLHSLSGRKMLRQTCRMADFVLVTTRLARTVYRILCEVLREYAFGILFLVA
jgi:hypothetical protein